MSWQDIIKLLSNKEILPNIIFLRDADNENIIIEKMTSLANSGGGKIIVGLDYKNKHLIGCQRQENWFLTIAKKALSSNIQYNIDTTIRNDKNIITIEIITNDSQSNSDEATSSAKKQQTKPKHKDKLTAAYSGQRPIRPLPDNNNLDKDINTRQQETLEYLSNNKEITNRKYRELFAVSHKTAHLELTDLVNKNLLKIIGSGRSTSYISTKKDYNTSNEDNITSQPELFDNF